jgi:hypothetical protein
MNPDSTLAAIRTCPKDGVHLFRVLRSSRPSLGESSEPGQLALAIESFHLPGIQELLNYLLDVVEIGVIQRNDSIASEMRKPGQKVCPNGFPSVVPVDNEEADIPGGPAWSCQPRVEANDEHRLANTGVGQSAIEVGLIAWTEGSTPRTRELQMGIEGIDAVPVPAQSGAGQSHRGTAAIGSDLDDVSPFRNRARQ